jgi:hypothetical protein
MEAVLFFPKKLVHGVTTQNINIDTFQSSGLESYHHVRALQFLPGNKLDYAFNVADNDCSIQWRSAAEQTTRWMHQQYHTASKTQSEPPVGPVL